MVAGDFARKGLLGIYDTKVRKLYEGHQKGDGPGEMPKSQG